MWASGGGSWSRNGVIVFSPLYGLYRVSQDGGPVTPVETTVEGTAPGIAARKGRGGRLISCRTAVTSCLRRFSPRAEIRGIYVGSLDSKETRRLLSDYVERGLRATWLSVVCPGLDVNGSAVRCRTPSAHRGSRSRSLIN